MPANARLTVRKSYADTPYGQVHLRRVDGPGAPIVLLHRTPVESSCFGDMLTLMQGKRAALAFDTPGFGQSFRPFGSPSARDYAAWFLSALDTLGVRRFHLCAHHTGTHFAAELAWLAPDRTLSLLLNGVLYADPADRADMRQQIGTAPAVDEDGDFLRQGWSIVRSYLKPFQPDLARTEFIGAIASPAGRDQAFDAILGQDFAAVLSTLRCPIGIVQAVDDLLCAMLPRVKAAHPEITIAELGPAGIAAPERQAAAYARHALHFAEAHDQPRTRKAPAMTDRRYQLVRDNARFRLEMVTAERPKPGPGQILLRVHAASINRRDNMILNGEGYPTGDADYFTPLSDAAGVIAEIGDGVENLAVGDRVMSCFFQDFPGGRASLPALMSALGAGGPGVLADHVVLQAGGVAPIPVDWSFAAAATLPCAAVTAWSALMHHGPFTPDDWVLVMGTGGVAIFALQIAAAAGAKVMVISSSDAKLERAKALGAAATVNYVAHPDWEKAVMEITGGIHHAVELGGSGTLAKSLACLAIGGHAALVGALTGFGGEISAAGMVMGLQRVSAVSVGSRADLVAVTDFLVAHHIQPVIEDEVPFEGAQQAYDRAHAGVFGKMVIHNH